MFPDVHTIFDPDIFTKCSNLMLKARWVLGSHIDITSYFCNCYLAWFSRTMSQRRKKKKPCAILTDFKVSGPKSWNVQIAMSVKLRLPCFSKDIQAWLLHAFDICRLVSPPPPAGTGAGAPRRTADRHFVGSQVHFLSRSPFLLTSPCRTCLSQCSQSSWK